MAKYKIVYLKDDFFELAHLHPNIVKILYLKQNHIYNTKQVELLFSPIQKEKNMLLDMMNEREDYTYFHGIHQLLNPITNELIQIQFNEYDVEVEENESKHIIFDIFKGFSQNFFMIVL